MEQQVKIANQYSNERDGGGRERETVTREMVAGETDGRGRVTAARETVAERETRLRECLLEATVIIRAQDKIEISNYDEGKIVISVGLFKRKYSFCSISFMHFFEKNKKLKK